MIEVQKAAVVGHIAESVNRMVVVQIVEPGRTVAAVEVVGTGMETAVVVAGG